MSVKNLSDAGEKPLARRRLRAPHPGHGAGTAERGQSRRTGIDGYGTGESGVLLTFLSNEEVRMNFLCRWLTISGLRPVLMIPIVLSFAARPGFSSAAAESSGGSYHPHLRCEEGSPLCAEVANSIGYEGKYIGHDEPSLLFYSDVPGSGNNTRYTVRLPTDPSKLPQQDGSGGTFNFQLHPAFW